MFQARGWPEPAGSEEAAFGPEDIAIRFEQLHAFGGSLCFTQGLQSPRLHASRTQGDYAEFLLE